MGQWAGAVREMPVPVPKQSNAGTDQNAVRSTTKWATSLRLEPSGRKDPYGAPVSAALCLPASPIPPPLSLVLSSREAMQKYSGRRQSALARLQHRARQYAAASPPSVAARRSKALKFEPFACR